MSMALRSIYPDDLAGRDQWILTRRPRRNTLDPSRPYAFFVEEECSATGEVLPVATVFLTNRECPWRCLMCDLWKNTLIDSVPAGAIPSQINKALRELPPARQIKLYNSGSFFDPGAIPLRDYVPISNEVSGFDTVIVESHPALIGANCFQFKDQLTGRLEVAMGLETANPRVLDRLNKRMTLEQFASAADALREHDIDLRVFILVKPPFMKEQESLEWARRSLDFAFECGATAATLIPTRAGNGALDQLALGGDFAPPQLSTVETALEYGLSVHRGRVFADLWDTNQIQVCSVCHHSRLRRLRWMNLNQSVPESLGCDLCGGRTEL